MGVEVRKDNVRALVMAVKKLTGREVLIGIPRESAAREDATGAYGAFNNAAVGFINEFGSPAKNIPPRPHLVPGVRNASSYAIARLKAAGEAALSGNVRTIDAELAKAGIKAASEVQLVITAGIPPPLAASTLYRRKHRKVAPRSGETPLEDTGAYRQAITYVIRDKAGGGSSVSVSPSTSTPGKESDLTGAGVNTVPEGRTMPLLDVSEIILDPDFFDDFTVVSTTRVMGAGAWRSDAPGYAMPQTGVVIPSKSQMVRLPDGSRLSASIDIYTRAALTNGAKAVGDDVNSCLADIVTWRGRAYTVAAVEDRDHTAKGTFTPALIS